MAGTVDLTGKIKQKTLTPDNPGFFMVEAGDIEGGYGMHCADAAERAAIPYYQRQNIKYVVIDGSNYKYEINIRIDADDYHDDNWILGPNWVNVETDKVLLDNYVLDTRFTTVGTSAPIWSIVVYGGNSASISVNSNGYLTNNRSNGIALISTYLSTKHIKQNVEYTYGMTFNQVSVGANVQFGISAQDISTGTSFNPTYTTDNTPVINPGVSTFTGRFMFTQDISSVDYIQFSLVNPTSNTQIINAFVIDQAKESILTIVLNSEQEVNFDWVFKQNLEVHGTLTVGDGIQLSGADLDIDGQDININEGQINVTRLGDSLTSPVISDNLSTNTSQAIGTFLKLSYPAGKTLAYYITDVSSTAFTYKDLISFNYKGLEFEVPNISGIGVLQHNVYKILDFPQEYGSYGSTDGVFISNAFESDPDSLNYTPQDGILEAWRSDVHGDSANNTSPINAAIYANGFMRVGMNTSNPAYDSRHLEGTIGGSTISGVQHIIAKLDGNWKRLLTNVTGVQRSEIIYEPISNTYTSYINWTLGIEQMVQVNNTTAAPGTLNFNVNLGNAALKNSMFLYRIQTTNAGVNTTIGLSSLKTIISGVQGELYMKDTSGWNSGTSTYTITSSEANQVDYLIIRAVVQDADVTDGIPSKVAYEVTFDKDYVKL